MSSFASVPAGVSLGAVGGIGPPRLSLFFSDEELKSMASEEAVSASLGKMGGLGYSFGYSRTPKLYRVLSSHPKYLEMELKSYDMVFRGDGPLPLTWRNYIAIMAASRYNCEYLVHMHRRQFLANGGDPSWLKGLSHAPKKLTRLQSINAILAHRPWLINKDDIGALTEEGSATFSVSEVLLAICIMSIVHSHAGFVLGMGLCLEPEDVEGDEGSGTSASPPRAKSRKIRPTAIGQGGDGGGAGGAPGTNGDFDDAEIFQRLGYDIEKLIEDDDTREEDVFEQVEGAIQIKQEKQQLSDLSVYCGGDQLDYEDYSVKDQGMLKSQEFSWVEQCHALLGRYYPDLADHFDEQFEFTYEMTYNTFGDKKTEKKTDAFRQAVWYYVHRLVGICNDDYEYRQVNLFLTRPIKEYTKTVCCFPETVVEEDFEKFSSSITVGEKCHVNLLILEARKQAELIYGIRAITGKR